MDSTGHALLGGVAIEALGIVTCDKGSYSKESINVRCMFFFQTALRSCEAENQQSNEVEAGCKTYAITTPIPLGSPYLHQQMCLRNV